MVRRGARARFAVRLNGMWGLALTKLDVLTGIDPLRMCVAYQLGAKRYDEMPPGARTLERARPVYEEMPGWSESLSDVRAR